MVRNRELVTVQGVTAVLREGTAGPFMIFAHVTAVNHKGKPVTLSSVVTKESREDRRACRTRALREARDTVRKLKRVKWGTARLEGMS
ncbi:MAG: hypothetical protein KC415_22960 [Anaerolineales bacterium]|nr:hypothetical protein [Anaerolineales bacterium]MCB8991829.1 hypothetical protein [Ardenticatenaceae bacterium]